MSSFRCSKRRISDACFFFSGHKVSNSCQEQTSNISQGHVMMQKCEPEIHFTSSDWTNLRTTFGQMPPKIDCCVSVLTLR